MPCPRTSTPWRRSSSPPVSCARASATRCGASAGRIRDAPTPAPLPARRAIPPPAMPEGDSIFRAARTLHRALAGHVVTRFDTAYAPLARVHDDTPITGRTIEAVEARGKHLVMHFSGDLTGSDAALSRAAPGGPVGARLQFAWRGPLALRTHMRMHGSWHVYRPGERWQRPPREMRVLVATADLV